jgi:hypothetical protein
MGIPRIQSLWFLNSFAAYERNALAMPSEPSIFVRRFQGTSGELGKEKCLSAAIGPLSGERSKVPGNFAEWATFCRLQNVL